MLFCRYLKVGENYLLGRRYLSFDVRWGRVK